MPREVTLPKLGENVEGGKILAVKVSPGTTVSKGQPLIEVEAEKATVELPAPEAGKVTKVLVKTGDVVTAGQVICVIDPSMMESEQWLASTHPLAMVGQLWGRSSDRKRLLFVVACWRDAWHLIANPLCRAAVHTLEQYAETRAVEDSEVVLKHFEIEQGLWERVWHPDEARFQSEPAWDANTAVVAATILVTGGMMEGPADAGRARTEAEHAVEHSKSLGLLPAWRSQSARHVALLRHIFGNPFKPVTINPAWLTSTVVSLAQAIYDERAFDRLPVLADALEESGCTSQEMLEHCREPGEHVRGCWLLDLVLGKE